MTQNLAVASQEAPASLSPRTFQHVPCRIGKIDEIVELASAAQPKAAVDRDAFSIHIFGLRAQKISREIGQFIMPAEALHRMMIASALFQLFRRKKPRKRSLGRKRAGGDGVETNPVPCPLHLERTREGQNSGLGAR